MNKFEPEIEYQPRNVIKTFQEGKMREALDYLNAKSPFYKKMFTEHKIDVAKIKTLEDLRNIPFTSKEDLQRNNKEFFCVAPSEIRDYITTSGTLSDPTTFAMTENDLVRLAYNEAISFTGTGGHSGEVYQLMTTIDKRFMAGYAYCMGIRMMGGGLIRVGNGIPELQWDTIQRIHPDAIICVPSFILRIIRYAEEHGIDYKNSSIKKAVCIGENLRNEDFSLNLLGSKIKEKWDVQLFATYSSTEMGATFSECEYGMGGHVHPELIIVEIIGEDDMPVPDGEAGEIVVTTLGVEAMPLLRFRTGDIATKIVEQCKCGRNSYRLTPLIGRKNNMIKLKGTTLYPPAINDVLDNTDYIENYVIEVHDSEAGTDDVIVKIGLKHTVDFDVVKELKDSFRSRIRVAPKIEILPVEEIQKINFPAKSRKPIKFIDLRKK